jgi:hypothetical protein
MRKTKIFKILLNQIEKIKLLNQFSSVDTKQCKEAQA